MADQLKVVAKASQTPDVLVSNVVEALRQAGVVLTFTGATMPENLTYDEWADVGRLLLFLDKRNRAAFNLALGAWYNHGEGKWGEAESWVMQHFPEHNVHTLQNWASVEKKWPMEKRLAGADWSTYQELSYVADETARFNLLKRCTNDGTSVKQIREMLKQFKRERVSGEKARRLQASLDLNGGLSNNPPADSLPIQPSVDVPLEAATVEIMQSVDLPEETEENIELPGMEDSQAVAVVQKVADRWETPGPYGTFAQLDDTYWWPRVKALGAHIKETEGEDLTPASVVDWCLKYVIDAEGVSVG